LLRLITNYLHVGISLQYLETHHQSSGI